MAAVGELVLVLGLLVSARCEVRARDPEVEEEEEELGGRAAAHGGGGAAFPPHLERFHPGPTETPPLRERGSYPARSGNWCAFVQNRVVTVAMECGTEKYTIKSRSPCPSGTPDCELVMYKLATRPVYRQKQKTFTALLWRCCPGHGGNNCEDTVPDAQLDSGSSALGGRSETARTDVQQLQRGDPNREQNDHQASTSALYDSNNQRNSSHPALDPGHVHNPHHTPHHAADTHHHHQQEEHHLPAVDGVDAAAAFPYPQAPAALPVPHMMALVMSQLQPVLEGFNRSLEHLSRQVGDLARDVAQLKSSQLGAEAELQAGPADGPDELDEATEERLDTKLHEVSEQVREVRRQMENQRADMEYRLHSQHAMLHYNLTSFKTDIDMKLKRHNKMLQVSLQAMNATLAELKLEQDQTPEDQLEHHLPPPTQSPPRPPPPQPSDTSALWEAIERLDNMVVNNTVKLGGLMEDVEVTSGNVQQLKRNYKELEKQINSTARTSQVQFMETGLEVEAAREVVLRQVGELAGNLSQQDQRLQDMEDDMDNLYIALNKHNTGDCDCKGLMAAVARLERGVANVTEPAVETLQYGLQQVKESLNTEQTRTGALNRSLSQLSSSVAVGLAEVSGLKETDRRLLAEMQHLSGSFNSLLKDAIRHSDVLELLLGEEVLEFLEWPVQDQEAHSIPALKEQLRHLQEQLRGHNLSITSLLGNRPGAREEVPSADQPSSHLLTDDWLPTGSVRRSSSGVASRERQVLLQPEGRRPEHGGDGSDLWNLERAVEELELKVLRLEEKLSNTSAEREAAAGGVEAKLQAEVKWLKRGLEEHLRVFKNVFSNAEVLAGSDATLELDKLWQLVKDKDGKKEKKKRGGGNHRSRRESSGVAPVPSSLSEAGSPLSVSTGVIVLEASLNRGQFFSDAGTFTAPVTGIYLFVLTLDLRPGPAHVVLRRGSGGGLASVHRQEAVEPGPVTGVGLLQLSEGEEVRLELKGGAWAESEDNVFTVLLLHRTT